MVTLNPSYDLGNLYLHYRLRKAPLKVQVEKESLRFEAMTYHWSNKFDDQLNSCHGHVFCKILSSKVKNGHKK